jgi:hypothetical protein
MVMTEALSVAEETFEVGTIARAVGIPPRRLEGWVERGVMASSLAGAGPGHRRRFSRGDALRVAIVFEVQKAFGTALRPGTFAGTLAQQGEAPVNQLLAGIARRGGRAGPPGLTPMLYAFLAGRQGLKISVTWLSARESMLEQLQRHGPVLVLVDLAALWRRVEAGLSQ